VRFSPGASIHETTNATNTGVMKRAHAQMPVSGAMGIQPTPTPTMAPTATTVA
jgi:hypothetical protein